MHGPYMIIYKAHIITIAPYMAQGPGSTVPFPWYTPSQRQRAVTGGSVLSAPGSHGSAEYAVDMHGFDIAEALDTTTCNKPLQNTMKYNHCGKTFQEHILHAIDIPSIEKRISLLQVMLELTKLD